MKPQQNLYCVSSRLSRKLLRIEYIKHGFILRLLPRYVQKVNLCIIPALCLSFDRSAFLAQSNPSTTKVSSSHAFHTSSLLFQHYHLNFDWWSTRFRSTVEPRYKHSIGSRIHMLIREVCLYQENWLFWLKKPMNRRLMSCRDLISCNLSCNTIKCLKILTISLL